MATSILHDPIAWPRWLILTQDGSIRFSLPRPWTETNSSWTLVEPGLCPRVVVFRVRAQGRCKIIQWTWKEDSWKLLLISSFLVLNKQIDNGAFIQSLCRKATVTSSMWDVLKEQGKFYNAKRLTKQHPHVFHCFGEVWCSCMCPSNWISEIYLSRFNQINYRKTGKWLKSLLRIE